MAADDPDPEKPDDFEHPSGNPEGGDRVEIWEHLSEVREVG